MYILTENRPLVEATTTGAVPIPNKNAYGKLEANDPSSFPAGVIEKRPIADLNDACERHP